MHTHEPPKATKGGHRRSDRPYRRCRLATALTLLAIGASACGNSATAATDDHSTPTPAPTVTSAAPSDRQSPIGDEAELQDQLDALVDLGVPGAVLMIRDGDRSLVLTSGVADLETGAPIDGAGTFRIASVTKPYVATIVFQLADEGRLSIDDTIQEWLPGLVPNGDHISIRQLLSHRSGIADYFTEEVLTPYVEGDLGFVWSPDELIGIAVDAGPVFEPGADFAYSNAGYAILGRIIEQVTGHSLGEELEARIFEPLELTHTRFATTATPDPTLTRGYLLSDAPPMDVTDLYPFYWGAGNIVADPGDVAEFYGALLGGGLLEPASLADMASGEPDSFPGAGLWSRNYSCGVTHGHDGTVPGYNTDVQVLEGGRTVVLFANSSTFDDAAAPDPLVPDLWTSIMDSALCG
ncbi:MAG: serine hydrolase domain-containing protein [Acidimicrobiales bacterium]